MKKFFDNLNLTQWEAKQVLQCQKTQKELAEKVKMSIIWNYFELQAFLQPLMERQDEIIYETGEEEEYDEQGDLLSVDSAGPPSLNNSFESQSDNTAAHLCPVCGEVTYFSGAVFLPEKLDYKYCLRNECIEHAFVQYLGQLSQD